MPDVTITSITAVGTGEIARVETASHTYVAAGFFMHNSVNEFRAQLNDQAKTFVGKDEFGAALKSLTEKVDDLKAYRDSNQGLAGQVKALSEEIASLRESRSQAAGRQAGIGMSAGALAGTIAAAVGVLSLVVVIVNVLTGSP